MKAIIYWKYGSPDVLELADVSQPVIEPDEVLVAVKAAGLNQMDIKLISGQFKMLSGKKFPKQVGADFSGNVVSIGNNVSNLKIGDEIFAYTVSPRGKKGTLAEYFVAKADQVAKKPADLPHEIAAALPCVYQTALQGLRNRGNIKRGDRILIYGASGGVGSAAIQLATYMGASVTTVSSARNREYCLKQGAKLALAYDENYNVWDQLPKQYDIIFQVYETTDSLFRTAKKHLKPDGVFLVSPNIRHILSNFLSIISGKYKVVIVKGDPKNLSLLAQLTVTNCIKPDVSVFHLDNYKAAFSQLTNFKGKGKIVIKIDDPADVKL